MSLTQNIKKKAVEIRCKSMISGSNYGTSDETTDTLSSDRYHIMIYMLRGSQFVQF